MEIANPGFRTRTRRPRSRAAARGGKRLDPLAPAAHRRPAPRQGKARNPNRARPPTEASAAASSGRPARRVEQPQGARRALLLPPPSPAPIGMRFSRVNRPRPRQPVAARNAAGRPAGPGWYCVERHRGIVAGEAVTPSAPGSAVRLSPQASGGRDRDQSRGSRRPRGPVTARKRLSLAGEKTVSLSRLHQCPILIAPRQGAAENTKSLPTPVFSVTRPMPCELILALDVPDREARRPASCASSGARSGWVKIGLQMFTAYGPDYVRRDGRTTGFDVFLDLKLHDIPQHGGARRSTPLSRAAHRDADRSTPPAARRCVAARPSAQPAPGPPAARRHRPHLARTPPDLARPGVAGTPGRPGRAGSAALAVEAGSGGLVCSPLEIGAAALALPAGVQLVTPGIRPAGEPAPTTRSAS